MSVFLKPFAFIDLVETLCIRTWLGKNILSKCSVNNLVFSIHSVQICFALLYDFSNPKIIIVVQKNYVCSEQFTVMYIRIFFKERKFLVNVCSFIISALIDCFV